MWSLFAAAAGRTSKIRLGPEVTKVVLKDPTIIAQQATTLDELTGGRAELVFSTGNFALLQQYGVDLRGTKPISRLREAHRVLTTFLAEDPAVRRRAPDTSSATPLKLRPARLLPQIAISMYVLPAAHTRAQRMGHQNREGMA